MIKLYFDNSIKNKATTKSIEMTLKSANVNFERIVVDDSNLSDVERMLGDKYSKPFITDGFNYVIGYDPVSIHKLIK